MTVALAAPVAVMAAFAVAEVVKEIVGEVRPCRSMPHAYIVDACPAPSDYAFPSGPSAVAAATVAALFLLDRRLSAIAAVFAVAEGYTRVYVGAHYPHDVLGSVLLALPVAYLTSVAVRRWATPLVASLGRGALLTPNPQLQRRLPGSHAVGAAQPMGVLSCVPADIDPAHSRQRDSKDRAWGSGAVLRRQAQPGKCGLR
ncbi:phosphatase PAP2 family protein [Streptomyces bungoensis]